MPIQFLSPLAQRLHKLLVAVRGEVIYAVQMTQPLGHLALFQPERDDEDRAVGLFIRRVLRALNLHMHEPRFADGLTREAHDDHVGRLDRIDYGQPPVLTTQQILLVQPRIEAVFAEPTIQFAYFLFIARGVAEEGAQPSGLGVVGAFSI